MENATEYIPITMLLLVMAEVNGTPLWIIHLLGITFVIGRLMHAYGIAGKFKLRVQGMWVTVFVMTALVITNLVYLPYDKLV